MPISRRHFLAGSSAAAASVVAAPHVGRSADVLPKAGQKPRHIIHLVSDGMSAGTLTGADYLSNLTRKRGTVWLDLYKNPAAQAGLMNMRSLNSLVTDSSAASSSWGSGSRIANGAVNVLPDGRELKPLYSLLGEAGWKRALVTTTEITHATPAGFAANDGSRGNAEAIATQYLERRVDVLLGGGRKFFDPKKRKDNFNLWDKYREAGYQVMLTASDLNRAPKDPRWLGTFYESHLPYTVDQQHDAKLRAAVPTLAEMTRAALSKLESEPHFIMQVEGGRVDHGCHTCDAAAAFYDQIAFDDAIAVCLDFQRRVPDTLLVITTDHGNGNPGLNGTGKNYSESPALFAHLKDAQASFDEMLKRMGKQPSPKQVRDVIQEATGYLAPEEKAAQLVQVMGKKGSAMYDLMNSVPGQLGQLMANHWAVGWTSNSHTADYVQILAFGPGAERFRGFIQNTDVFRHYLVFAGIDFRNPELPLTAGIQPSRGAVEHVEEYWRGGQLLPA